MLDNHAIMLPASPSFDFGSSSAADSELLGVGPLVPLQGQVLLSLRLGTSLTRDTRSLLAILSTDNTCKLRMRSFASNTAKNRLLCSHYARWF